ncbi:MAG: NrsF family protein [Paracoccaceae bacterium]
MKTDDLIAVLAAETGTAGTWAGLRGTALLAAGGGLGAALLIFALFYGVRPDLSVALRDPMVACKTLLPALAALAALPLALGAARPGAAAPSLAKAALALPVIGAALVIAAWVQTAPADRMVRFIGHSIPVCVPSIILLSAPVLAGLLAVLRSGAPDRPARCGAFAGLAAGSLAAVIYGFYCNEDSPLFYVFWYGTGILAATLIGASAGSRLLRW